MLDKFSEVTAPIRISAKNKKGDDLNYVFPDKSNISYLRDYLVDGSPRQTIFFMKGSERGVIVERNLDDVLKHLFINAEVHNLLSRLDSDKLSLVKEFIEQMNGK